jgi:hypothetical protein
MSLTLRANVKYVQFGYPAELWIEERGIKELPRTPYSLLYCVSFLSINGAAAFPSPDERSASSRLSEITIDSV